MNTVLFFKNIFQTQKYKLKQNKYSIFQSFNFESIFFKINKSTVFALIMISLMTFANAHAALPNSESSQINLSTADHQSIDLMCKDKAKEIAALTYKNCVYENKQQRLQRLRQEYQKKLNELKNYYSEEINKLSSNGKQKSKPMNQNLSKSPVSQQVNLNSSDRNYIKAQKLTQDNESQDINLDDEIKNTSSTKRYVDGDIEIVEINPEQE